MLNKGFSLAVLLSIILIATLISACGTTSQTLNFNSIGILNNKNSSSLINFANNNTRLFYKTQITTVHELNNNYFGVLLANSDKLLILNQQLKTVSSYKLKFKASDFCSYGPAQLYFLATDTLIKLNLLSHVFQSYPLGYVATNFACNPTSSTILLINTFSHTIYFFDTQTQLTYLVKEIPFAFNYYLVTPNFQAIYFILSNYRQILAFSLINYTFNKPIKLPSHVSSFAFNSYYYFIYMLNPLHSRVYVLDLQTSQLLKQPITLPINANSLIISKTNFLITFSNIDNPLEVYQITGYASVSLIGSIFIRIPYDRLTIINS